MSTLFVILCFRVTTTYLNINQASVETEARGVPPNQTVLSSQNNAKFRSCMEEFICRPSGFTIRIDEVRKNEGRVDMFRNHPNHANTKIIWKNSIEMFTKLYTLDELSLKIKWQITLDTY